METLCTIIATGNNGTVHDIVEPAVPLKEAILRADKVSAARLHRYVRVYAETNNGATLTLIYQPTGDNSK